MWFGTWTNGASASVTRLSASPIERPSRDQVEEQIGGARLIALQDGVGERIDSLVLADVLCFAAWPFRTSLLIGYWPVA